MIDQGCELQMGITFERMQLQDVGEVADLDTVCFPNPWSIGAYITELRNPSAYYIVARHEGRVIGYAGVWLIMDEAHITTIGVHPSFRGLRIGERMLVDLLNEGLGRGARRATLEVRRHNLVAQKLYQKYGFRVVGIRPHYYTSNNEDAFVMWVDDLREPKLLDALRASKEDPKEEQ